jgi:peptide/nickel transport system substrate-binding protein
VRAHFLSIEFALCIGLMLAVACGPAAPPAATGAPAATAAPVAATKTITIGSGVDIESADPMVTTSATSRSIMGAIFDTLVVRDNSMAIQPSLAMSWDTPDSSTWIFHLRDGVKFHNGDAFDATAVKFTLERFVDPATKAAQAGLLKPIRSVEVVDPRTVKVSTNGAYAALLSVLSDYVYVMNPAVKGQDANKMVIGTGAYQFVDWQPGQRVTIKANPSYWGKKAQLDQIMLRPIPDAAARLVELKTGGVDIISPVAPTQYADVSGSGANLSKAPGTIITIMFNVAMKPFDDVRVRQAVNYAVDKEAIIKGVLQGAGYELASVLRQGMLGYDANLKPYPYDPARARSLLGEAGQTNLTVELGSPDGRYPNDKLVAQAVAAQLSQVGITTNVATSEYGAYVQNIIGHKLQFFLIGQTGVTSEINMPQALAPGGALYQNWDNQQAIQLIQQASSTLDTAQREAIYKQVEQMAHDDPPWLFLYSQEDAYGVAKRVSGFTPHPDAWIPLNDMGVSQ